MSQDQKLESKLAQEEAIKNTHNALREAEESEDIAMVMIEYGGRRFKWKDFSADSKKTIDYITDAVAGGEDNSVITHTSSGSFTSHSYYDKHGKERRIDTDTKDGNLTVSLSQSAVEVLKRKFAKLGLDTSVLDVPHKDAVVDEVADSRKGGMNIIKGFTELG